MSAQPPHFSAQDAPEEDDSFQFEEPPRPVTRRPTKLTLALALSVLLTLVLLLVGVRPLVEASVGATWSRLFPPPPYTGVNVYVTLPNQVAAFRASDGTLHWKHAMDGRAVYQLPDGGVVIDWLGAIVALNGTDGSVRWRYAPSDAMLAKLTQVVNGVVYAVEGVPVSPLALQEPPASHLVAIDAGTGKARWRYSLGNPLYSFASVFVLGKAGDRNIYVCDNSGTTQQVAIDALNAHTGAQQWRKVIRGEEQLELVPLAVANNLVFIISYGSVGADNAYYAFETGNGAQRWRLPRISTTLDESANVIYNVTSGKLTARNTRDLSVRWQVATDATASEVQPLGDGLISVASNAGAHFSVLSSVDGSMRWQVSSDALFNLFTTNRIVFGIEQRPNASDSNDTLYVYAFDAATGERLWFYRLTPPLSSESNYTYSIPVVVNGVFYIGDNQALYAFDAQHGTLLWQSQLNDQLGTVLVGH